MAKAPDFLTPEQFSKHYGWSPRKVRQLARQLGACRIIGNRMVLLDEDVRAILEAAKPAPSSVGPLATGDYAALVKMRASVARHR
ncbi:hypothetical protein QD460_24395 [Rhizobium jaguaris]